MAGRHDEHVQRLVAPGRLLRAQLPTAEQMHEQAAVGFVVVGDEHPLAMNHLRRRSGVAGRLRAPFQNEVEPEGRPFAGYTVHADTTAHQLDQLSGDRQAQSGATEPPGGRAVHLGE
jgi:hypothetical protein